MNEDAETLEYARPSAFRRRRIPRSAFVVLAILLCSIVAALIEFRPTWLPHTRLLAGDRRAIPSLLVWLLAIVYIIQRTREDARWPCAGLAIAGIGGALSLTFFAFQCIVWREQLKYQDRIGPWSALPLGCALAAFAMAAVGRRLTRQCSGPEPRV